MLWLGFDPSRSEKLGILGELRIIIRDSVAVVGVESDKTMVGANRGICVASLVCSLLRLMTLRLEERQIEKKQNPRNASFG